MENNQTVEGTINLVLEAKPLSEEAQKFLLSLKHPMYIKIVGEDIHDGCPVCGSFDLLREGRCTTCLDCGWSKCSI